MWFIEAANLNKGGKNMEVIEMKLNGVFLICPQIFGDSRGWFMESYSQNNLLKHGIKAVFVQDNHSLSAKRNTLRGLHFQKKTMAQAKLIRCTKGKILDVAVDIREGSPTYKEWISVELSEENKKQLYIPKGFAHGFLTLTDDVEVQYKVDEYYAPEYDRSIRYDDPEIGVDWGIENPILSDKDLKAPLLKDSDINF
jgi:dTDP-4-dehydrorhamnose 3,5-epimerase